MNTNQIHMVGRIDQVVRDYFSENPSVNEVKAKELMPLFIKKEIFNRDYKEGLPIRNLLRTLDKESQLGLLKHCTVIRKTINRNWYFNR